MIAPLNKVISQFFLVYKYICQNSALISAELKVQCIFSGIESRLRYLKDLDVKGIWISPFFKSPMVDNGYDVSDYCDIDPIFGSLQHFQDLIKTSKTLDIKVILDFVPNHTSDQHEWFIKSCQKVEPYSDFYVWHSGKNGKPPSNWVMLRMISRRLKCIRKL